MEFTVQMINVLDSYVTGCGFARDSLFCSSFSSFGMKIRILFYPSASKRGDILGREQIISQ